MEFEEDGLELSGSALAALHEFFSEKDEQAKRFEALKAASEERAQIKLSMDMFAEDWNASQFWSSDKTSEFLAKELLDGATDDTAIAVVSAPSIFIQIKNLLMSGNYNITPRLCLLEFDDRFSILPEYVHYDYRSPMDFPEKLKGQFDRLMCDPPFLNDDCQIKVAMTMRILSRQATASDDKSTTPRIIVCTGERMESLIQKVYPNMRTTSYEPKHAQDRLSNEYLCYANYESASWSYH